MTSLKNNKKFRSTRYTVEFPTFSSLHETQPRKVELIQAKGKHDLLVLEYSQVSPLWFSTIKSGVPVTFTWRYGNDTKHWIGYVQGISKTVNSQRSNLMTITCWGSTFVMKAKDIRVFTNMTIPDVVKKIVTEHGYRFHGDPNDYRPAQLIMSGQSDWEWIQMQADLLGYGAYADGMDFYFKKLDNLINSSFNNAAVLTMDNQAIPVGQAVFDKTLQRFKVLNSEYVESDKQHLRSVKNVGGVDPVTNEGFLVSRSPQKVGTNLRKNNHDVLFNQYLTETVANNRAESIALAHGAATMGRFKMPAHAQAQGDIRIRPHAAVYIGGTGELTDGYWLVEDVCHTFTLAGDHEVTLNLVTDGIGNTVQTPFRKRDASTVGTINLEHALNALGNVFNSFLPSSVRLHQPEPVTNQGNQGFKRTPAVWRSTKMGR